MHERREVISQRKLGYERHRRSGILPNLFVAIGAVNMLNSAIVLEGQYRVRVLSFCGQVADPVEADPGNGQLNLERAAAMITNPSHPANGVRRFARRRFSSGLLGS